MDAIRSNQHIHPTFRQWQLLFIWLHSTLYFNETTVFNMQWHRMTIPSSQRMNLSMIRIDHIKDSPKLGRKIIKSCSTLSRGIHLGSQDRCEVISLRLTKCRNNGKVAPFLPNGQGAKWDITLLPVMLYFVGLFKFCFVFQDSYSQCNNPDCCETHFGD